MVDIFPAESRRLEAGLGHVAPWEKNLKLARREAKIFEISVLEGLRMHYNRLFSTKIRK